MATYSQEKKEEGKNYNGWVFICNSKKSGDEHYYQAFKKNYVWLKTVFKKPDFHFHDVAGSCSFHTYCRGYSFSI